MVYEELTGRENKYIILAIHRRKVIKMENASLILEGGATRGVFTSGVLDYLMEQDLYFSHVIGVSAGSCNAVDYVSKQIGRTKDCMIPSNKSENYFNLKRAVKQKSLFDMDLIFDKYPNEVFPFDYETYFDSPIQCEVVATNCLTGEAEYLTEKKDKIRLMQICRASSSMPLVSPIVEVDGIPYLDGGVADSIPILHSMKEGYRKDVIILTRRKGYRKKVSQKSYPLYHRVFKKYPELVRAIALRPIVYNRTLDLIERWEEEGKVFVVRPEIQTVSRTESDYDTLMDFYTHGYRVMKRLHGSMMEYLQKP